MKLNENNVTVSINLPDGTSFTVDSRFFEFAAILWDKSKAIRFISPRIEEIFGKNIDELYGKNIEDLIAEKDRSKLDNISDIMPDEEGTQFRILCIDKDENEFLTEWITVATFASNLKDYLYLTIIRDLTSHRKMQIELTLQNKYMGLILDNTETELWELYPETCEVTFKNNLRNLLGIQPDAQVHDLEWFHGFIHEDDLPIVKSRFESFVQGKSFEFNVEYRVKTGNNKIKWVRDIGTRMPVVNNNQPEFVGIITDISKTKRSEQLADSHQRKYKAIFDASYEILILVSPDGQILDCNEITSKKFGYSKKDFLSLSLEKLFADIEISKKKSLIEKFDTGESIISSEAIHEDGHRFPVEIGGAPFKLDEDSEAPDTLLLVVHDISEKKQNESEQLMFAEKLKKAQRYESLGILAGGIAHEFNNIFGGILGNAELAMMTVPKDGKTHQLLTKVHEATERAARVTQQMLAYSGQGAYDWRPLHLSRLVESMKSLVRASCSSMVDIHYELEEDLLPFTADLAQMRQVVLNLVSNAAEAIGRHSGRLTIRSRVIKKLPATKSLDFAPDKTYKGEYLVLEFDDTGQGMDNETRSKMFEPFFTTKFIGRGLGLAAVQGIVHSLEGGIKVKTKVDQGTKVTLYFPPDTIK